MSVKLRKVNAQIRDPDKNNQLVPFGLLGSDAVETIESAKTQAISEMETKRATSLASIPDDYSTLAQDVSDLKGDLEEIEPGLSAEAKAALLDCFAHVAWIDEYGQDYYDALADALNHQVWDYKWYASQDGALPPGMTFKSGTTPYYDSSVQALYIQAPQLNFEYIGDCTFEMICRSLAESSNNSDPQFHFYIGYEGSGQGREAFLVFNADSNKKVYATIGGNEPGISETSIDGTEFHKYRIEIKNGIATLYVDDVRLNSGYRISSYAKSNTIYCALPAGNSYMNFKSIKYKMATDWFDQMEWCYPGNLSIHNGGAGNEATLYSDYEPCLFENNGANSRASFWVKTGRNGQEKVINYDTGNRTDFFAIPVPTGATKLSAVITPSTYYMAMRAYDWKEGDIWSRRPETGWTQGTITQWSIPTIQSGYDHQYITINVKFNSSGTSGSMPTGIAVTFE